MQVSELLILAAVFFLTSIVSVVTGATSLITAIRTKDAKLQPGHTRAEEYVLLMDYLWTCIAYPNCRSFGCRSILQGRFDFNVRRHRSSDGTWLRFGIENFLIFLQYALGPYRC
jgi:hypothetical protein